MIFKTRRNRKIFSLLSIALLVLYGIAGLSNQVYLLQHFNLDQAFMSDFRIYERAVYQLGLNQNPYLDRAIGSAFLYPPPAALIIQIFELIPAVIRDIVVLITNIGLLFLSVHLLRRAYGVAMSQSWWWYYIAALFGPTMETITIGQINLIVLAGVTVLYFWENRQPILSGIGLGTAIMMKMSPALLLGYLVFRKKWRVLLCTLAFLVGLSLVAGFLYGFQHFQSFLDAVISASGFFGKDLNNQGLITKLSLFGILSPEIAPTAQLLLTAYFGVLLIISAVCYHFAPEREAFFIVTIIVMTLYPPFVWYHHYVFLLIPIFILLAWKGKNPLIIIWVISYLLLIQVDRYRLTTGLVIHLFGHLTIIGLLIYQLKRALPMLKPALKLGVQH